MTRRAMLAGLFSFLKAKRKMAFTSHYIDKPNEAFCDEFQSQVFEKAVRIGDNLWSVCDTGSFNKLVLYKSTSAGVSWTAVADLPYAYSFVAFYTVVVYNNLIYVILGDNSAFSSHTISLYWANVDPAAGTPTWSSWSALPFVCDVENAFDSANIYAETRPDGSLLVAHAQRILSSNATEVRKYIAGTWSDLGSIGVSGDRNWVQTGLITSAGLTYLFLLRQPGGAFHDLEIDVVTVDAADAIGSFQLIQATVNDPSHQFPFHNYGRGAIAADGTLAIAFGDQLPGNSGFGNLKVAFGDTTVPLTPTWTITQVTDKLSTAAGGTQCAAPVAYLGAVPWIYFSSCTPSSFSSPTQMYRSSWTGSVWNTPDLWFDPAGESVITSGYVVTNIQLLRAFGAAGLGVLANFGYPTYAVYDGPPLAGPRNYASAGGALANVGKYAA